MNEKTIYRLYALAVNAVNAEYAAQQRFNRITPGYILVYTADGKPTAGVEVRGKDLNRLTASDAGWLFDCNVALIAEEAARKTQDIAKALDEKLAGFEAALEEEQTRLTEGENGNAAE